MTTALDFDLVVPRPTVAGFDLAAIALGHPLAVLLEAALQGHIRRPPFTVTLNGSVHDVVPVSIPDRVSVPVNLGRFGAMAFGVENGHLIVIVPATVAPMLDQALAQWVRAQKALPLGTRPTPEGWVGSVTAYAIRPDEGFSLSLRLFGLTLGIVFP